MRGRIGCTNGSVIVVDDAFTGVIQCGQPASRITVTGDLTGRITPPHEAEALLNLRVDGYMPSQAVLDVMSAGFTRVNATIGISDTQPGLYPVSLDSDRPVASRWVVLRQRVTTAR